MWDALIRQLALDCRRCSSLDADVSWLPSKAIFIYQIHICVCLIPNSWSIPWSVVFPPHVLCLFCWEPEQGWELERAVCREPVLGDEGTGMPSGLLTHHAGSGMQRGFSNTFFFINE